MSDYYSGSGGFGGFGDYTSGFGGGPAPINDMSGGFDMGGYNPLGGSDMGYLGGPTVAMDPMALYGSDMGLGYNGGGSVVGFDPAGGFTPDMTGYNANIPGYGYAGGVAGAAPPPTSAMDALGMAPQVQPGAQPGSPMASLMAPQALAAPGGPMAGGASEIGGLQDQRTRSQQGGGQPGQPQKSGGILDSLGIKNPAATALAAGGLAYNMINGQGSGVGGVAMTPQMTAQANSLNATGKELMGYLKSGTLPPGLKTSLDQATAAAKAKVIQNFASQGMPTDPNLNSALAQQLAQIDQQAIITTAQIGQQLLDSGAKATGLSSDVYKTLAGIDQTQSANMSRSIANFAAALNGGQPQQTQVRR